MKNLLLIIILALTINCSGQKHQGFGKWYDDREIDSTMWAVIDCKIEIDGHVFNNWEQWSPIIYKCGPKETVIISRSTNTIYDIRYCKQGFRVCKTVHLFEVKPIIKPIIKYGQKGYWDQQFRIADSAFNVRNL